VWRDSDRAGDHGRGARSSCWGNPSKRSMRAVLAFLADGESWSSSAPGACAWTSHGTVQRARGTAARLAWKECALPRVRRRTV
jgi:hypothetical protein